MTDSTSSPANGSTATNVMEIKTCNSSENLESDPLEVEVLFPSNTCILMESCNSVKPTETVSSTEDSAATDVPEIKTCDLSENLESDPVGVEILAPSNSSILMESCNSVESAKPEVFETRKVLVTPFTPVQLSLLKLASEVPKVYKKKSIERAVERKVIIDPRRLTVSVCLKPKPASAKADTVRQLHGCLNREATATATGEGKSNQVDTKVTCSCAGVLPSVPQWSSLAHVRNVGQHCQCNRRKKVARRKRNAAKRLNGTFWPSNTVNTPAVSRAAKLPAFQPLIAFVPAIDTSIKSEYLSKSQRRRRNRAMRRLIGISDTANNTNAKVADDVELLSSLLQSSVFGPCTGNYESAKYRCERQIVTRRQASGISDKSTTSIQTCVNVQSPSYVEVTSTKGVSVKETTSGKMTLRPRRATTSSSSACPTQDLSSAVIGRSSGDDQRIVDLTTGGSEVSQFIPELLLSVPASPSPGVFTLDSYDCETTETLETSNMRDITTSRVNGIDATNDLLSVNDVERKRKHFQTGLSPSEAIVIDDEDIVTVDNMPSRETHNTFAHLEGKPLFFQASSSGSNQCGNLSSVGILSETLSCISGVVSDHSCSYISASSSPQFCSSSQQLKLLSYPERHCSSHFHPYRNRIKNRSSSQCSSDLMEMLQCHTAHLYKSKWIFPVNPHIVVADIDPGEPAFAFYSVKRSTQADVERIFGEPTSLMSSEDNTDIIYTANDVEQFDERKRLAKELDKIIGDVIVID